MADKSEAGRPRDDELTKRILDAVLLIVAENGVPALRMDDVAKAAATSKQALYRRWPTKEVLIVSAIRHILENANPVVPDTGCVRDDLSIVLSNTVNALQTTALGNMVAALIAEDADRELVDCILKIDQERRNVMLTVLRRGLARGELSPCRDLNLDIDMLLGTIYFRLLVRRKKLESNFGMRVVTAWLPTQGGSL